MKLSEAVRIGSQWVDIHGPVMAYDGSCCAIGGVMKALKADKNIDGDQFRVGFREIYKEWPILREKVEYPGDGRLDLEKGNKVELCGAIINLFETDYWSKKAIAEWVETIEKKLENEKPKEETVKTEVRNTEVVDGICTVAR